MASIFVIDCMNTRDRTIFAIPFLRSCDIIVTMTQDLLVPLALFAFVTSITPGPNNLMLLASGATFGFRATIPHLLGVGAGFVAMLVLTGLGLLALFEQAPWLHTALKALCLVYLMWLAWKIATATRPDTAGSRARPMTFLQAVAFQWVNPKAWAMATSAVSLYAPDRSVTAVLIVGLVFGAVNLPSVGTWTLAGERLGALLEVPRRVRAFNIVMAVLLVLSVLPML
jgi:threonine/homoserine/homoserine lactone efflux protein